MMTKVATMQVDPADAVQARDGQRGHCWAAGAHRFDRPVAAYQESLANNCWTVSAACLPLAAGVLHTMGRSGDFGLLGKG